MEDLINTIPGRYRRSVSYRGFSTLTYLSKPPAKAKTEDTGKRGMFDFFRPQIAGISQKIHAEINKLLERREKTVLQTVHRDVPRLISQQTRQWKAEGVRAEKSRVESVKRTEKRVDLVVADTNNKLNSVKRELERLKAREKTRQKEQSQIKAEDLPLSHRAARREIAEYARHEREEFKRELGMTERRVVRRLRDEQDYEKRRRG